MLNITCDRKLGSVELADLIFEGKLLDAVEENKAWVGDGMLYRTTKKGTFHFADYKLVSRKEYA